jgi:hypothetical protein
MAYLTSDGFDAPRSADFLQVIRDEYEADTGLTIDWERDVFLGSITANMADRLGGAAGEGLQALYDAMSRGSATGIQLANIGVIVGVPPNDATFSTATVTLTGIAGTVIIAGNVVEGGGINDDARWDTLTDVTIGGGGTVDVVVQAEEEGSVEAIATQIDKIVTPVSGWTSVSNAIKASPGDDKETDGEYRARQEAELSVSGAASAAAIRSILLGDLDFLTGVIVLENDDIATQVVEGITMPGKSSALIVLPDPLTTDQIEQMVTLYYTNLSIGIETVGAESTTILGADGISKTVRFGYATSLAVTVAYVLTLDTGVVIGDVDQALIEATEAYGATLSVGDALRALDLYGVAAGIPGIKGITSLLLNGGAADIEPAATEQVSITSVTAT